MEKLIVILGPTASGKTKLAVDLAKRLNGEIISADSRQVYKEMDIGTGKDLDEYGDVPYHLIDICEPGEKYNINDFHKDFTKAFQIIKAKGKTPILCGGSGLYLQTALRGNDLASIPVNEDFRAFLERKTDFELEKMFQKIALKDKLDNSTRKRKIRAIEIDLYLKNNPHPREDAKEFDPIIFGIDIPREVRRNRITERLNKRMEEGLILEVKNLLKKVSTEDLKYYGLEYKFVTEFVEGKFNLDELFKELEIAIHQFAKRQMTWFRKMEKDGMTINWLPYELPTYKKITLIEQVLKKTELANSN